MFSSIKSRVMIPVLCIFVIFVGYSSIQNYIHAKDYIYTSGTNLISQEINQVNLLIDQKSRTAADLALWISADQEIAAAFANKDREKLLHLLNDTYKDLKTELNINQFQFNLSPATAFLRFHKPDHHGDDLTGIRPTLVEANTTRKPQIGLESGRSGMGIRGVVPVKFHDNHIGTIEFGMAVNDQLLLPLKKKFGFDAAILVPQDGGFSFQAKTFDMRLSEQNISIMKNVLKTGERQSLETEENGKHILTSYGPLRDFAGKNVGIIAIPEDMTELIDSTDRQLLQTSVAALVAVCIVFLIANFIVNRFIKTPLDDFLVFLRSIEKGDYSAQPRHGYKCEMAKLADGLGAMSTSISEAILSAEREKANAHEQAERAQKAMDEARAANEKAERAKAEGMLQAANQLEAVVEVVTSVSEKLSAQIEQSSRGSEEQARRIGETATAMEEMNATVLEVSKNAARAAGTSDDARKKAQDGEATVGDVVKGIALVEEQALKIKQDMGILGQRAESIGQILTVISDIADQTNLLALNAAIEAARAGDAGRGFAVVADEVRKLAEKTMTATKEVGEAIAGIQDGTHDNIDNFDRTARTIDEATALAGISGASLRDIVQLVDRASDQVRSIATAAEEQSASSEEINRSIEQVAAISAETARSMGQAAEAVSDLARQAQVLQAVIARMKSEGGDTAAPTSGSSGTARPALADAPRRTHSLAPAPAPVGAARPTASARPRKALS